MTTLQTQKIINLTRGVPPTEAFPTEDLIACEEAALRKYGNILLQYAQAPGFVPMREWLADHYTLKPGNIFMGNSSLEILNFITQLVINPGDTVFAESPTYDRTNTLLKRAGARIVDIPMEKDGMDMEIFEKELKKNPPVLLYIVADFQNPMGSSTSAVKRQQLAKWAEQYNFWIVEDAPYRPLRYMGKDEPTIMSLSPDKVLHLSSFSKLLAPGIRFGYMVGPESFVKKITAWAVDTYIGPVMPTQGMVYEYCTRDLLGKNIEKLKGLYKPRLEALLQALEKYLPQADWTKPEGGFFVSVFLPDGNDMDTLIPKADREGLKLTDGRGFFIHPNDGERFLRIPFCSLNPEELDNAIERLAPLIN